MEGDGKAPSSMTTVGRDMDWSVDWNGTKTQYKPQYQQGLEWLLWWCSWYSWWGLIACDFKIWRELFPSGGIMGFMQCYSLAIENWRLELVLCLGLGDNLSPDQLPSWVVCGSRLHWIVGCWHGFLCTSLWIFRKCWLKHRYSTA